MVAAGARDDAMPQAGRLLRRTGDERLAPGQNGNDTQRKPRQLQRKTGTKPALGLRSRLKRRLLGKRARANGVDQKPQRNIAQKRKTPGESFIRAQQLTMITFSHILARPSRAKLYN